MTAKIISVLLSVLLFITACDTTPTENQYQGYIETQLANVAAPNHGKITEIAVTRGQSVKRGDLLYKLELQPLDDQHQQLIEKINATQAEIQGVQARVYFYEKEVARNKRLVASNAVSDEAYEKVQSELAVVKAQHQQLQANLAATQAERRQIQWQLDNNSVYAPIDAQIFDELFLVGERVAANQAVLTLLDPRNVYAVFFVPEPQLSRIKVNDTVNITCDKCTEIFSANINFISPRAEFTPPVIYSRSARSKLVYRVEATLAENTPLKPGQPIDVYLA